MAFCLMCWGLAHGGGWQLPHTVLDQLQGGGLGENAIVPMNLSGGGAVDVVVTGSWSRKSAGEAKRYADVRIAADGIAAARRSGRDVVIVDTAGRLTIDAEMMEQVRQISATTEPHYTFLENALEKARHASHVTGLPALAIAALIAFPPPWTRIGRIPTVDIKITSFSRCLTASVSSIVLPPSLITTCRSRNCRIQASASSKTSALRTASS